MKQSKLSNTDNINEMDTFQNTNLEEIIELQNQIQTLFEDYELLTENLVQQSILPKKEQRPPVEMVTEVSPTLSKKTSVKLARWLVNIDTPRPKKVEPIKYTGIEKKQIAESAFQTQQQIEELMKSMIEKVTKLDSMTCEQFEVISRVNSICDSVAKKSDLIVKIVKQARNRELSLEDGVKLIMILKKRFESKDKHYKSAKGIIWANLKEKLLVNPEKLWLLNEMERTGGEPDVLRHDKKTDEYVFMDCSQESPAGRRNCVYEDALSTAALMGIDLLTEVEYLDLQKKGKFDLNSSNWLKSPLDDLTDVRWGKTARVGGNYIKDLYAPKFIFPPKRKVIIHDDGVKLLYEWRGWRGSLLV